MSNLSPSLLAFLGGPASIDWCEPNYAVSSHVAEFANTWSSLFMCATAAYAMAWKWRQGRELRFLLIEMVVIVIGLGSALFHGTLTFYGQLADELPMLWGAFIWVWVVLHTERRSTDWYYVGGLATLAIAWTAFSHIIHFTANWIFEVFFGMTIFWAALGLLLFVRRSKSPLARQLLIAYLVFSAVAFLLWNLDQWYCSSLAPSLYSQHPHWTSLHAWWHNLMAFNMYAGSLLALLLRHEFLFPHDKPRVEWSLLPVLQLPTKAKK